MPNIQILQFKTEYPRLRNKKKYRRFNNSLLHLKGDYYLMSYRLFYPSGSGSKNFVLESRRFHPWSSGWKSLIDTTVLAVLKWSSSNRKFSVVNEMKIQYPERFEAFENNLEDARLVKLNGRIFAYGQAWVDPEDPISDHVVRAAGPRGNATVCLRKREECYTVVTLLVELEFENTSQGLPRKAMAKTITMPCVSQPYINTIRNDMSYEKNWCFFESQGQVWFEHFLHPHIVISLNCKKKYETPSPFETIRKHFGCGMFFSPGGPLNLWKKGQLIGVGHIKYRWNCLNLLQIPKNIYKHPEGWGGFVYAMFFYVIENKPPFRMLYYSNAFLPSYKGQHYALVFPMGCVPLDRNKWAIPYGEGDDTPNVLFVSTRDIKNRLISCKAPEHPSKFNVTWWPSHKML